MEKAVLRVMMGGLSDGVLAMAPVHLESTEMRSPVLRNLEDRVAPPRAGNRGCSNPLLPARGGASVDELGVERAADGIPVSIIPGVEQLLGSLAGVHTVCLLSGNCVAVSIVLGSVSMSTEMPPTLGRDCRKCPQSAKIVMTRVAGSPFVLSEAVDSLDQRQGEQ